MKSKAISFTIVVIFIVSSCVSSFPANITPTAEKVQGFGTSTYPVLTEPVSTRSSPSITSTSMKLTATVTPSLPIATATYPEHININVSCNNWITSEVQISSGIGTFLFLTYDAGSAFLYDIEIRKDKEIIKEQNEMIMYLIPSPNHEKAAYQSVFLDVDGTILDTRVTIIDEQGNKDTSLPLGTGEDFLGWLDDDFIIIKISSKTNTSYDKIKTIKISTGEERLYDSTDLPGYDQLAWNTYLWSTLIIDPSSQYVAYPSVGISSTGDPIQKFSIFDYQKKKIINDYLDFNSSSYSIPKWSPIESEIAFISSTHKLHNIQNFEDELYVMSIDDQVGRLTNLTDIYKDVAIGEFSWSPDGKKIAFWLVTSDDLKHSYLTILDKNSGIITKTCIKGLSSEIPSWSDDGTAIIVQEMKEENNPGEIVFIDPTDGSNIFSGIVTSNYFEGWMGK